MGARLGLLLLAGACNFSGRPHGGGADLDAGDAGGDAPATPWLAGFTTRYPVDLGAGVASVTDFPLAIRAADAGLVSADPQATVAVTSDDGTTRLPVEIEQYDRASGALAVWVRVPALAAGTHLWLYGGGSVGAVPVENALPVWDPAHYQAVWHLSDDRDLTTARDSTAAGEDLVAKTAPGTPADARGLVAHARQFDGDDDMLEHDDVTNGNLDLAAHSATITMWVDKDHSANLYDVVLIKGNGSVGERGYDVELGSNGWFAYVSDGGTIFAATFGSADTYLGRWVALAIVIDREHHELRLYADAVQVDSLDITNLGSITGTSYFQLGLAGYQFAGVLDEVRLAGVAEDVDWLADEHANLADPAFVTVGAAEDR